MQSHSCQFIMLTTLPQLAADRVIRQIAVKLQDLKLIKQSGRYAARGLISREIRYTGPDGLIRKIEGQLQFEAVFDGIRSEQVLIAQSKLCQDYFLFQPQPDGGGPPTLEQGLTLTLHTESAGGLQTDAVANWWLNRIIQQGRFGKLAVFNLSFPEKEVKPRECTARFMMEPYRRSEGVLRGVLEWTVWAGEGCQYYRYEQQTGFLVPELPPEGAGELTVRAKVNQVSWQPEDWPGNEWRYEAVLEFEWHLTRPELLPCAQGSAGAGLPVVKLKSVQPLGGRKLRLGRTITLTVAEKPLTGLEVTLEEHKEEWLRQSLLLTVKLRVELYYLQTDEVEAYQQWTVNCDELIPPEELPVEGDAGVQLQTAVTVEVQKYFFCGNQLRIELGLFYNCRFGREQLIAVVPKPDSNCRVLARVQLGTEIFTASEAAEFALQQCPIRINEVKAVLRHVSFTGYPGKIQARGAQEVAVVYSDAAHRQRTDIFRQNWQASFLWDLVDPAVELNIDRVKLFFEKYTTEGRRLFYQSWWEWQLTATRLREVPVALDPAAQLPEKIPENQGNADRPTVSTPCLKLEWELGLRWRGPVTIATEQIKINHFCCRRSGQALLVSGQVDGVVEYWERGSVLRREKHMLPFWRFMPYLGPPAATGDHPFPRVQLRKGSYQSQNTWPWAKGRVKLAIELELGAE